MIMKLFRLPDLGEGLQEARIIEWYVQVGDIVAIDQTLVSVETAKAIVEIPSPEHGRVTKLFGVPGDLVLTNAPLVEFEAEAGEAPTEALKIEESGTKETPPSNPANHPANICATPKVRHLARMKHVDLSTITPSRPDGMITESDVEKAALDDSTQEVVAIAYEELRGIRKVMAVNMEAAKHSVVQVTIMDDADVTAWGGRSLLLSRLIRAIATGCRTEPGVNAWYENDPPRRQLHAQVDVGIAVDTPHGLLVAVLRNAERQTLEELSENARTLIDAARERTLPPSALSGHTITLSNYGSIGGRYGTPIVVPPTVAILGVGRTFEEPALRDGQLYPKQKLPLSLSFDHRALFGGEAGRFLAAVISDLEKAT